MTHNPAAALSRERVRSVGKLLLSAVAVGLLASLATLLPGVDTVFPGTAVTFEALLTAVGTVAVAGTLLYTASGLATLTAAALSGPKSIVENAASVVYWLAVLLAVLVAHRGLAPLSDALLGGTGTLYDGLFLLAALGPLVVVAARLYVSLDPMADRLADRVVGEGS